MPPKIPIPRRQQDPGWVWRSAKATMFFFVQVLVIVVAAFTIVIIAPRFLDSITKSKPVSWTALDPPTILSVEPLGKVKPHLRTISQTITAFECSEYNDLPVSNNDLETEFLRSLSLTNSPRDACSSIRHLKIVTESVRRDAALIVQALATAHSAQDATLKLSRTARESIQALIDQEEQATREIGFMLKWPSWSSQSVQHRKKMHQSNRDHVRSLDNVISLLQQNLEVLASEISKFAEFEDGFGDLECILSTREDVWSNDLNRHRCLELPELEDFKRSSLDTLRMKIGKIGQERMLCRTFKQFYSLACLDR
ncbi:MAG: hypothetical protein Q9190_000355 [Brigantiaea leucoxantha]